MEWSRLHSFQINLADFSSSLRVQHAGGKLSCAGLTHWQRSDFDMVTCISHRPSPSILWTSLLRVNGRHFCFPDIFQWLFSDGSKISFVDRLETSLALIGVFSYVPVWKQLSVMFLKCCLANRGPELFSNRALLNSGFAFVIWVTWPLQRVWGGEAYRDLVFTSTIGPRSLHCHASPCFLICRSWSFPTAVLGNMFARVWFVQSRFSAYEKFISSNAFYKGYYKHDLFYLLFLALYEKYNIKWKMC